MNPAAALPPGTPFTCHVTVIFDEKLIDAPAATAALDGVIVNTGASTVTPAVANLVTSAVLTAIITTVCAIAGAV